MNSTKVVRYDITDDGFIFYDENGNVPDPSVAYWDGDLDLWNYTGKSLKGLPSVVNERLSLRQYKGNDFNNLPKEYEEIRINDKWHTKDQFDDFIKTEKLKKALLD